MRRASVLAGLFLAVAIVALVAYACATRPRDAREGAGARVAAARARASAVRSAPNSGADTATNVGGVERATPPADSSTAPAADTPADADAPAPADAAEAPCIATVSGSVFMLDGKPAIGAVVGTRFLTSRLNSGSELKTDEGKFKWCGHEPGRLDLVARLHGFLDSEPVVLDIVPGFARADVTLVLEPGAALSGVVLDRAGVPVAGVQVVGARAAEYDSRSGSYSADASTITDSTGKFSLTGLTPDERFVLFATQKGRTLEERDPTKRTFPAGTDGIVLVMLEGATITGRVVDTAGAPVTGARIGLEPRQDDGSLIPGPDGFSVVYFSSDPFSSIATLTSTEPDGRWRLAGVNSGTYRILCVADGYIRPAPRQVRLVAEQSTDGVDFALALGAEIRGRVLSDSGEPLAGVSLFASPHVEGGGVDWEDRTIVYSDPKGEFRVVGCRPGTYDLAPYAAGYTAARGQALPAQVLAGEEMEIRLAPLGKVRGRIVLPGKAGDQPTLAAVSVAFLFPEPAAARQDEFREGPTATPNVDDGSFELVLADCPSLTLQVSAPGLFRWRRDLGHFDPREDIQIGDIVMARGGMVRVAAVGTDGKRLADAEFRIRPADEHASTDRFDFLEPDAEGDGIFHFVDLDPGSYNVSVRHPRYPEASQLVEVPASGELDLVEFKMTAAATLVGRVWNLDGQPLGHADVSCQPTDGTAQGKYASADGEGRYRIEGVPAGELTVRCDSAEPSNTSPTFRFACTIVMPAAGEMTCDLGVPATCKVVGVLQGWRESPDRASRLWARLAGDPLMTIAVDVPIATDGSFTFPGLPPGTYDFDYSGFRPVHVTIPAAKSYHLDIQVPGGTIRGRVRRADGARIADDVEVRAQVRDIESPEQGCATARAEEGTGLFALEQLPIGVYVLDCVVWNYGRARVEGIELSGAGDVDGIDVEVPPGGTLWVSVVDGADSPVTEASWVAWFDQNGRIDEASPFSPGSFAFRGLAAGEYRVCGGSPKLGAACVDSVTVSAGKDTTLELKLDGTAVELKVAVSAGGAPVRGAMLTLFDSSGRPMLLPFLRYAETDGAGHTTLGRFPPGRYQVVVVTPASQRVTQAVEIHAGPEACLVRVEL